MVLLFASLHRNLHTATVIYIYVLIYISERIVYGDKPLDCNAHTHTIHYII